MGRHTRAHDPRALQVRLRRLLLLLRRRLLWCALAPVSPPALVGQVRAPLVPLPPASLHFVRHLPPRRALHVPQARRRGRSRARQADVPDD